MKKWIAFLMIISGLGLLAYYLYLRFEGINFIPSLILSSSALFLLSFGLYLIRPGLFGKIPTKKGGSEVKKKGVESRRKFKNENQKKYKPK